MPTKGDDIMKFSNHVSKITVGSTILEGDMDWKDMQKLLLNATKQKDKRVHSSAVKSS